MELVSDVDHVESHFSPFGDMLVSVQDRCTVCTEHTVGTEIVLMHSMGLLGDEAQVEARFGPFGDSATLDVRLVHGLRRTYCRLGNSIGGNRWNS
jgi:hypothetical protein